MGILSTITSKKTRSLENPKIPLSDPAITEYLGTSESYSGAPVNRVTSLGLSAFWRGVNLISRTLAKVPMDVYKRIADDGREVDDNHPAQWVLHHEPNRDMTPMVFKQTMQAHALIHGNAYAYIVRDNSGDVMELLPLLPECTYIDNRDRGSYVYRTRLNNVDYIIQPEDMLHIKGLSHDGIIGYSVIDTLREVMGFGIALQRYGNIFFRNNAAPKIVIKFPLGKGLKTQEAVERLRQSWARVHGGLDNAHKPAILEDGTDVTSFGISNKDVEFMESRKFSLLDLANVFGMPAHKLGDQTKTSYASLEQENQSFLDDTMDPWFVTWEHECMAKLLRVNERLRESRYIEFKRQALVRADFAQRTQAYHNLLLDGVVSRDEVRRWENMNPIPDGEGKKFYTPLNVAVDGEVLKDQNEPQPEPEVEQPKIEEKPRSLPIDQAVTLQREKLDMEQQRFWRRIAEHAKRAAQKPQKFHEWLDVYLIQDNRAQFSEAVRPIIGTITILTRGSTGNDTAPFVDEWFSSVREQLNDLTGHVTADELETRVTAFFTEHKPQTFGGNGYAA